MKKKKKLEEIKKTKERKPIMGKIVIAIELLIGIIGLYFNILIRNDTAELSKLTDKPLYYTINLYPNEDTSKAEISDKYLSADLTLVVDDFEIKKNNFLNVNYNATFTKIKYFMVYDYSLKDKQYKYMRYTLDDRSMAKFRLEDEYEVLPTKLNYSFTPNKEYLYILIYTETSTQKNLDLIFFKYHDSDKTFTLDTIFDDGKEKIDIKRIEYDTLICKEYFVDLWQESKTSKDDIEFMFDVYEDLRDKIIF